jgi:hypothetical protein
MQTASQSFLKCLTGHLERESALHGASTVLIGEVRSNVLHVYDMSGELELGMRLCGVTDDVIVPDTVIMNRISPGKYRLNRAQTVPRSLLGAVAV